MPGVIHHIAIEDDWEMSRAFGEYEVSTRGLSYDEVGFIHATTAEQVGRVRAERYADITLPLLDIALDVDALAAEGVAVDWSTGRPRILGVVPLVPGVVVSETRLTR